MADLEVVPITETQLPSSLSPVYHDHVLRLLPLLTKDECLFAAADCSAETYLGFVALSTFRVFRTIFLNTSKLVETRPRVRYFKGSYGLPDRYWFPPPLAPLSARDIKGKETRDFPYTSIHTIERNEFNLSAHHLLELSFLGPGRFGGNTFLSGHLAFNYKDGQRIYDLAMLAIHNNGKIGSS